MSGRRKKQPVTFEKVHVYEKHLQAENLAKLLAPAELDVESGRTRPARGFLKEFTRVKKNQR